MALELSIIALDCRSIDVVLDRMSSTLSSLSVALVYVRTYILKPILMISRIEPERP